MDTSDRHEGRRLIHTSQDKRHVLILCPVGHLIHALPMREWAGSIHEAQANDSVVCYGTISKESPHMNTDRGLNFDGFGINGPDEYRTRLATFTNDDRAKQYGPLFAAAPDLLAAAKQAMRVWPDQMRGSTLEAAIAKAEGR